ncbi:hypothetical protein [Streptomyces ehimensis]|uniref:hypothetical protein n=1 Tax=Streptomyces ehimensis TaxID=68195 RepID=UPI003AAA2AC5
MRAGTDDRQVPAWGTVLSDAGEGVQDTVQEEVEEELGPLAGGEVTGVLDQGELLDRGLDVADAVPERPTETLVSEETPVGRLG